MNSIDSQIPQMPEVRIARLEEECDDLREENARLRALAEHRVLLLAEVKRLEGLILAYEQAYREELPHVASAREDDLLAEARRIRDERVR